MEQMNHVRQRKTEAFSGVVQNSSCQRVAFREGLAKESRLAGLGAGGELGEDAVRVFGRGLAHFLIYSPSGAAGLDDRAGAIQADVADFGLSRRRAVVDFS